METRMIEVSVRGQEISCTVQHPYPRTNTVQYLHVHFDADAIWDPLKKIAVFRRSGTATVAVPLDETMMCEMPPQMLAVPGYSGPVTVHIGLIGVGENGSRLTTGEVPVTVNPSCYTAGKTPHPPAPDVYEELLRLIREAAENDVEEIQAALDAYFAENPIDVSGKLDKNQGAANAGKVLGIDENGMVVPVDAPTGNEGGIVEETDPTVPDWAKQPEKPSYTAEEVGADASGTADRKVSAHNTSEESHNDIRLLISELTARLNAIADTDDATLDQLSEIVAYIKANKGLIDSITTEKVNVADIINNLTTSATNKPLSAKMGVELKALIDAIKIPTSLPASDVYAWAKKPNKPAYTAAEVGAIAKNQGAANAGKILAVGTDGNLVPEDVPKAGVYYVATDYGISTDADDNTPALQALIDDVSESGGGIIFFPAGTYNFKRWTSSDYRWAVEMKSNVSIIGENLETTVFKQTQEIAYSLFGRILANGEGAEDPLTGCTFMNFTVDAYSTGNVNNVCGKAFFFQYVRDCVFRDLRLMGTIATAMGIDFLDRVVIDNVSCIDCGRTFTGTEAGTSGIGIGTAGWENENFIITNCICDGCGQYGIFIENQGIFNEGNVHYAKGCIISNCITRNGINKGIGIRGGQNVTVIGCESYENASHGIYIDNNCKNVKVLSCSGANNGGSGICIEPNKTEHLLIKGCTFVNNQAEGIKVNVGAGKNADKLCIQDCYTDGNTIGMELSANSLRDFVLLGNATLDGVRNDAEFVGSTAFNDLVNVGGDEPVVTEISVPFDSLTNGVKLMPDGTIAEGTLNATYATEYYIDVSGLNDTFEVAFPGEWFGAIRIAQYDGDQNSLGGSFGLDGYTSFKDDYSVWEVTKIDGCQYIRMFISGFKGVDGVVRNVTQGGDVCGYVDENNVIVLNGNLADGTYSVKYEMENGEVINIGNMVLDSNVYYSVTSTLTNCTSNNSTKTVVEGGSYAATITAKDGYELKSVVVTMGGSPVSVIGGNISIANVTGNIVITAVAEEEIEEIVNLATPDATATGEAAWNAGGWCNNSYMAGSSYAYRAATDGKITTNTIAVAHGDIIYVKGIKYNAGTFPQIAVFDSNKSYVKHGYASNMNVGGQGLIILTATENSDTWYFTNSGQSGADVGTRFIRIAGLPSGSINDIIITRNQPIS